MAAKPRTDSVDSGSDRQRGQDDRHGDQSHNRAEKRKSGGDSIDGEPMEKKVSMQMKPKIGISPCKGISLSMGNPVKPPTTDHSISVSTNPVKLSMGSKPIKDQPANLKKTSAKVASVFNEDDDSEEEEMPPEAKMRMKNIGRNTPTAAGPNSFGKGRLGFCDRQKVLEREIIKHQMEDKETKE